jgi:hypothetical protein
MRAAWIFPRPHKTEVARGMDFYELAADGCIRRVTGFSGPLPTVTSWVAAAANRQRVPAPVRVSLRHSFRRTRT